ncbi:MAG: cupin domain-containing protein [Betaproteobacteria bacterium]|jgi:mannose-6-phosphate isomerase-like protein (cupin superfamily)
MNKIPTKRVTVEEMRRRVALKSDQKGFDGGLPDSRYPSATRTLINIIGFQPPEGDPTLVSPVGAQAAENAAIKINEGFNLGFCDALPGHGPMMHNHDTNETFMPISGRWRCSWELDGHVEFFELDPCEVISFPPGVQRRFENVTHNEPNRTHRLMFVIAGNTPQAEFSPEAQAELMAKGYISKTGQLLEQ